MKKKELPSSHDTERAVLGCMLSTRDALLVCIDVLERDDFFHEEHKVIFEAIKKAFQAGRPADVHIIAELIKSDGLLDAIGGIPALTELCQASSASHYAEEYCCILKSKRMLRDIILASESASERAYKNPPDSSSFLDEVQKELCSIAYSSESKLGMTVAHVLAGKHRDDAVPYLDSLLQKIKEHRDNPTNIPISGIKTGYVDLDILISGLNPGNLIILSACTSMGKTALALNIAEHVACGQNIPVGIFSLEMTTDQLVQRMICSYTNLNIQKLVAGDISDFQLDNVKAAPLVL